MFKIITVLIAVLFASPVVKAEVYEPVWAKDFIAPGYDYARAMEEKKIAWCAEQFLISVVPFDIAVQCGPELFNSGGSDGGSSTSGSDGGSQ